MTPSRSSISVQTSTPSPSRYAPAASSAGGVGRLSLRGLSVSTGGLFAAVVLALSVLYAALAWTPSSYGVALRQMGVTEDSGLVLGKPRDIRSDEWAVWTPYLQIAVDNDFARYNAHSPYHEDLRNFNALPLLDWALPFKPQYWAFFLVDPAHAFAIYHAAFIALFLIGYQRMGRMLGMAPGISVCFSLLAFFAGYTQYAWTTTGPLLALFPWLLVTLAAPLRLPVKGLLLYWLSAVWLLSHFYPPVILSLGFVGAVLVLALRRDLLRWPLLATAGLAAALAAGTVYGYLAEPLQAMTATVYPGQRHSDGGSGDWRIWLSTVLPFITTRGFDSLIVHNIVETGAIGSYWPLLLLVFADWRQGLSGGAVDRGRLLTALAVLGGGLALVSAWMLLPIPAAVGKILLWDRVFPPRMIVAVGLLALVATALLAGSVRWRITPLRVALFTAAVLAAWVLSKRAGGVASWSSLFDGTILLVLAGGLALWRLLPVLGQPTPRAGTLVAGVAVAANLLTFGQFNPIQSAKPIFDRPQTALTARLSAQQAAHPKGWLVETLPIFTGAVLAGWGYNSIAHTLIAPHVDFFRPLFPDMAEDRFTQVFNRYAHIIPDTVTEPVSPYPDQVRVPWSALDPRAANSGAPAREASVLPADAPPAGGPFPTGGSLDEVRLENGMLRLRGWAPWTGVRATQTIAVVSDVPLTVVSHGPERRPDLQAAFPAADRGQAGFTILLRPAAALDRPPVLCVLAGDTDAGTVALASPRPANDGGESGCRRLGLAK